MGRKADWYKNGPVFIAERVAGSYGRAGHKILHQPQVSGAIPQPDVQSGARLLEPQQEKRLPQFAGEQGPAGKQPLSYEPFAMGWLQGQESWGCPVCLLTLPDGRMLVSDDQGGAVFRIYCAG